jgi:hypothetical protein
VAVHKSTKDMLYLQHIIDVVCRGNKPKRPIIFEDNTAVIAVYSNNKTAVRSRHFNIKYFVSADLLQREQAFMQYVSTADQVADIMTKATSASIFNRLSARLMGETDGA